MVESYKNFDRLRYRIHTDLDEIGEKIDKNSQSRYEEVANQFTSGIVSAIIASVITETSFKTNSAKLICFFSKSPVTVIQKHAAVAGNVMSISLYILGALIIYFIFRKIKLPQMKFKVHPIRQQQINYQKEFDNIACDSIFVALEYLQLLKDNSVEMDDINRAVYIVEAVHYIEKATLISINLCKNKSIYVKLNSQEGVEKYRIHIMKNALDYAVDFLKKELCSINFEEDRDKEDIKEKLDYIGVTIKDINV